MNCHFVFVSLQPNLILIAMCTYIINKRECQFPAIKFNELEDYATFYWGAKGIPYTCYYLAFKGYDVDDNVFLYNLISRLHKYGLIGQMRVFEGYIHEKADSQMAGRSIFVFGWVMPQAEQELRDWLDRLCEKNYVFLQPYWLAVGLEKAVDEVERRWK